MAMQRQACLMEAAVHRAISTPDRQGHVEMRAAWNTIREGGLRGERDWRKKDLTWESWEAKTRQQEDLGKSTVCYE